MQYSSLINGEPTYVPYLWPPPFYACRRMSPISTHSEIDESHHRSRRYAISRFGSPINNLSDPIRGDSSLSPTSETSEMSSIPRVGLSVDRSPRSERYNGTITIGTPEGVPITLIGRPPKKVGRERTMWSIDLASYEELGNIANRLEFAVHPSYEALVEEIARLKARVLKGRTEVNDSDSDNLSLSESTNASEDAAAHHQNGSIASSVTIKEELEILLRGASSQLLSTSVVLSKVLPWVESRESVIKLLFEPHLRSRISIFENLMSVLWQRFSDFWEIEVSIRLPPPIFRAGQ